MLPWPLYALTPKDALGAPIAIRFAPRTFLSQAGAVLGLNLYSSVPLDQVAVIDTVSIVATPGAAQNFLTARATILDSAGNEFAICGGWYNPRLAAAQTFSGSEQTFTCLFQGEELRINATFDAGVAANTITAGATGWLIPRGTLQR